jgi:hypothetical protein
MDEFKDLSDEDEHDIEISVIWPRTRSSITRQKEWDTAFTDQQRVSWNAQGSAWFSRTDCWSLIGEVSRSCLECYSTHRVSHLRVYDT